MHGNFTQDQLTLLVNSEHVAVKKLGNFLGGWILQYELTSFIIKLIMHTWLRILSSERREVTFMLFPYSWYPLDLMTFLPLRTYGRTDCWRSYQKLLVGSGY